MEKTITYTLTRKRVKNINLRIKADGSVHVSAHPRVPLSKIESFVQSKEDRIRKARESFEKRRLAAEAKSGGQPISPQRWQELLDETYQRFTPYKIPRPQIKYRQMTSSWGNCRPKQRIVTFNKALFFQPEAAIEYVMVHEFAHFIHPNHSKEFWAVVADILPDWKEQKKLLL